MNNFIPKFLIGLLLAVVLVMAIAPAVPVYADDVVPEPQGGSSSNDDDNAGNGQAGAPAGQTQGPPPNPSTPNFVQNTISQVFHFLKLPGPGVLGEAVVNAGNQQLAAMFGIQYEPVDGVPTNVMDEAVKTVVTYSNATSSREPSADMENIWRGSLNIALVLVPLTLILMIVSAMKEGAASTSVMGYDNAREAFLNWLTSMALMAASLVILQLLVRGSAAAAAAFSETFGSQADMSQAMSNLMLAASINNVLSANNPIWGLFALIFAIIMVFSFVASFIMSMIAREVVILLLAAAGPIIFALSSFSEFSFLRRLWVNTAIYAALLGPINVAVLGIAGIIASGQVSIIPSLGSMGFLVRIFTLLGVISVLMGLNSMFANMVFASVKEVAAKAGGATMGVLTAAASVVGATVGLGAGMAGAGAAAGGANAAGAVGGAANAAGAVGGAANAAGAAAPGGAAAAAQAKAASGLLGPKPSLSGFGGHNSNTAMTSAIGNALRATGVPGLAQLGQGLTSGAQMAASQNLRGMETAAAAQQSAAAENQDFLGRTDPGHVAGVTAKGLSALSNNESANDRFAYRANVAQNLRHDGVAPAPQAGIAAAQNVFQAAAQSGVSPHQLMDRTGYLAAAGGNFDKAVMNFGALVADVYANPSGVDGARVDEIALPRGAANDPVVIAMLANGRSGPGYLNDVDFMAQQMTAVTIAQTRGNPANLGSIMNDYNSISPADRRSWAENVMRTSPGGGFDGA